MGEIYTWTLAERASITTDHIVSIKFHEMVGHNPGPVDYILSDLDPR